MLRDPYIFPSPSGAVPTRELPERCPSWQEIIDDTLVRATWRTGADRLAAFIDAIAAPGGDRLATLDLLDRWICTSVPDRHILGSYVQDESIPAGQRTALLGDLAAGIGRIEELLDRVSLALGHTRRLSVDDGPGPRASGLSLNHPDAYIVESSLRAQVSTAERRLSELADRLGAAAEAGAAA